MEGTAEELLKCDPRRQSGSRVRLKKAVQQEMVDADTLPRPLGYSAFSLKISLKNFCIACQDCRSATGS
jgi:hypothetical protein